MEKKQSGTIKLVLTMLIMVGLYLWVQILIPIIPYSVVSIGRNCFLNRSNFLPCTDMYPIYWLAPINSIITLLIPSSAGFFIHKSKLLAAVSTPILIAILLVIIASIPIYLYSRFGELSFYTVNI